MVFFIACMYMFLLVGKKKTNKKFKTVQIINCDIFSELSIKGIIYKMSVRITFHIFKNKTKKHSFK